MCNVNIAYNPSMLVQTNESLKNAQDWLVNTKVAVDPATGELAVYDDPIYQFPLDLNYQPRKKWRRKTKWDI